MALSPFLPLAFIVQNFVFFLPCTNFNVSKNCLSWQVLQNAQPYQWPVVKEDRSVSWECGHLEPDHTWEGKVPKIWELFQVQMCWTFENTVHCIDLKWNKYLLHCLETGIFSPFSLNQKMFAIWIKYDTLKPLSSIWQGFSLQRFDE